MIVGSGGREHALAWAVRAADVIYTAPGNPGTAEFGQNIPIQVDDLEALVGFARDEQIDLVVVGPEVPLAAGLADALVEGGVPCFGPSAAAAEIESSKAFAKAFMQRYQIPTAEWRHFHADQIEEAKAYAYTLGRCVVKASGLAAGKGAIMCANHSDAEQTLHDVLVKETLGDAGQEVVVEEWMEGEEASLFVITDGDDYRVLNPAQDHKRVYDYDQGPNTGGMGAYAPAPVMNQALTHTVCKKIIEPVLEGMAREGRLYKGCLYVGLMITNQGPRVVEFNCRFGDPEAQVVLPLLAGDPIQLLWSAATRGIGNLESISRPSLSAACVVLASGGYPDSYAKGHVITGIQAASEVPGALVFHAGTRSSGGDTLTAGGRVLGVTALDATLSQAIHVAYQAADLINFEGKHARRDIGHRALSRE